MFHDDDCPHCGGTGKEEREHCQDCYGTGYAGDTDCIYCQGDGYIEDPCESCNGEGTLTAYEERRAHFRVLHLLKKRFDTHQPTSEQLREYWL